jgi:hypothetical protein
MTGSATLLVAFAFTTLLSSCRHGVSAAPNIRWTVSFAPPSHGLECDVSPTYRGGWEASVVAAFQARDKTAHLSASYFESPLDGQFDDDSPNGDELRKKLVGSASPFLVFGFLRMGIQYAFWVPPDGLWSSYCILDLGDHRLELRRTFTWTRDVI